MSKLRKIDIADSVMQRIQTEGITMRSRRRFLLSQLLYKSLFSILLLVLGFMLLALIYVAKNDIFTEYLALDNGKRLFINSLPWVGIANTVLTFTALLYVAKLVRKTNSDFKFAQAYASLAIFVVVVTALGGIGEVAKTPDAFAYASYLSSADPIKLEGTVESINGSVVIINTVNGEITVDISDLPYDVNVGDKILLLGFVSNNKFDTKGLKILAEAPSIEPMQPKKKVVAKKTEPEPAPVAKITATTTTTTTTTTKKTTSEPKPEPAPTKTITINSVTSISATKYEVKWSANFTSTKGFLVVWGLSPHPTYPANNYYYNWQENVSSGTGYVKNSYGAGTYYFKICEYKADNTCDVYSTQETVEFL